ncbi:MAG: hypothetical protein IPJ34_36945 [Myxococcales bacterium]|nr:hypothetical protein [Myxococcales bacterium]
MLCVGALSGANDAEGQALVAEALSVVPNAPMAKATFEVMEGLPSTPETAAGHAALEAALVKYTNEELAKLEKEVARPQFMRAQVGFNNNVKLKGSVYHIQTEDSGLRMPHIITHLFADGGRIIKSHKRSYADQVERADIGPFVRQLMKDQHMEMVAMLRAGRFDDIVAGKVRGGMEEFKEPPQIDMQQLASRKKEADAAKAEAAPVPLPAAPTPSAPVRFRLRVMRSTYGGPEIYEPPGDEVILGVEGGVPLQGEKFCHPREGIFRFKDGELFLEDLEGGNGIFIRIRRPVELEIGDEIVVGDQLLRIERNPELNHRPDPGPTYLWWSPCRDSSFRVTQMLAGEVPGDVRMAYGNMLQIGRREGDLTFPKDPRVAERHCFLEEQAGVIVLSDIMTPTGTFVRIRGEQRLFTGDELLVGRTVLRVEVA